MRLSRSQLSPPEDAPLPAVDSTARAHFENPAPVPVTRGEREPLSGADMVSEEISERAEWRPSETSETLTPNQLQVARARMQILIAAWPVLERGGTVAEAAQLAGVATASLWKILALALPHVGNTSRLRDRAWHLINGPTEALAPGRHTGRKCKWSDLLADSEVQEHLRRLYAATLGASGRPKTQDRHTGSLALTLVRFADFDACPPDLGAKLRRGYQPAPFLKWLRQEFSPEIEAKLRGAKHYSLHGPIARRDKTVEGPDGQRYEFPAGWLIELDDMSVNQPFWVERPDGSVILSRQGLYAYDVRTGRWLSFDLVARPREAYRAEDILRFLRRLCLDIGKPKVLRLEQGVWKSKVIKGLAITPSGEVQEEEWIRPDADPGEEAKLQDGLAAIGTKLEYMYRSNGKTIEGAFDYLQDVVATMTPEWVNIGRHAGEFEHGAKALRRARSGSHHPRELGFAPMGALADRISEAMAWINARPVKGEEASRDEQWVKTRHGIPSSPLTRLDLAAFLPTRRERMIAGGAVSPEVDGQRFDFRSELFAELGDGYRVFISFDVCEPTLGAAIYNREAAGNPRNFRGWTEGQFIGWAEFEPMSPQLRVEAELVVGMVPVGMDQYGDDPKAGMKMRRIQERWHATQYRALPRPGQPTVKAATVRDGQGNVATAEAGTTSTPATHADPKPRRTPVAHSRNSAQEDARLREFLEEV